MQIYRAYTFVALRGQKVGELPQLRWDDLV